MPIYLKQSTASQEVPLGYFVDSTDGNTEKTALSIANTDIKLWKTGATTLANKNIGGATHISNGIYYAVLDATDTDTLGPMVIFCHPTGALAVRVECVVLPANTYDSLIGGTDVLQADVTQFGGTNATTSGGRPEVNTTHAAGTAWGSGAITSGAFAAGAINAAAIAADAIGASELAADAVAEIADAVWDEVLSGHLGAGSTGEALNAAGAAGDPWTTALPGAYSAGQAGYIVGTNLNATVSSRSTLAAADIRTAVGLASANLDTQLGDLPTATENADALLARDIGSGTGAGSSEERTVRSALRFVRNKVSIDGSGVMTVTKEDDSTAAWTAQTTGTAGADPITAIDPT